MNPLVILLLIALGWMVLIPASWAFECWVSDKGAVTWGFLISSVFIGPLMIMTFLMLMTLLSPFLIIEAISEAAKRKWPSLGKPLFRTPEWASRTAISCKIRN